MTETQTTVPMDDAALFSGAMAADTPAQTEAPPAEATPETPQEQARDERGRFAVAKPETPAATVQPATEPPPQAQPAAGTVQTPPQQLEPSVPPGRLKEEADARRAAEARAATLERQLTELMTRLPKPEAPKAPPPPDFFENPEQATAHTVRSIIQPYVDQTRQTLQHIGRMLAVQSYGEDTVTAADEAFTKAFEQRTLDPADYHRVTNSPNIFAECVKWHKRQTALATVGDDPHKWFDQQLGERLKDQAFQTKLLEQLRGNVAQQPQNGSRPPAVQLPPSLSRVTAAAPNTPDEPGDMSDASLFRQAMR